MEDKMRRLDWIDRLLYLAALIVLAEMVIVLSWPAIEAWWHRPRPGKQVAQQFLGKVGEGEDAKDVYMDYLLYLPVDYDRDKTWPLVIYLHGSGRSGSNIEEVWREGLPAIAKKRGFPCILVSPQCPKHESWEPEHVLALIKYVCSAWPIDRQRVYLVGYSMGGFGTWQTAVAAPQRFAAIVPIAGGGNPQEAKKLAALPIWAFHGDADETVPLKQSQKMVDAVRTAGGNPKLTILENTCHGVCGKVCSNKKMWCWLLSQQQGKPVSDETVESTKHVLLQSEHHR